MVKKGNVIRINDMIPLIDTTFGKCLDFKDVIPKQTNAIILLSNDGTGYKTHGVHLPHQIYTWTLEKLAEMGAKEFYILPFYSNAIVRIGENK